MKTISFIFMTMVSINSFADKYTEQMTKSIKAVYDAASIEELQNAVNTFERIGGAEKSKWEPFYYASFGYVMMSTREKDPVKKDSFLDLAKSSLEKASAINSNESEILALEGFIYMMRVSVDPATRGQQYSMMAMQSYSKAIGANPNNPRALALMAQLQFGTAQFFKQVPTEACGTARKALALYEAAGDNGITIAPMWGKGMTVELVGNCK